MADTMFKFKPVKIEELTFEQLEYRRNGVSGDGFYSAVVNDPENGKMLITYFEDIGQCACAVYKLDILPDISFGINSWRGDCYSDQMAKAIKKYRRQFDKHYGIKLN
jgi:hypothetical protein